MKKILIVSTAHEVVEALPVRGEVFSCKRCGKRGSLKEMFSADPEHRCTPHYEAETSGWEHDTRFKKSMFIRLTHTSVEAY